MNPDNDQHGRGKIGDDVVVVFDYALLDPETRIKVEQKTGEIKTVGKRVASDICEMGEKFAEVRNLLAHNKAGGFEGWIDIEGFERTLVYRCIQVSEAFGNRSNLQQLDIGISALYTLAAPSTPVPARETAIKRAESGEKITHKKATEIIQEHKPVTTPPKKSFAVTYTAPQDDYVDDVPAVELESTYQPPRPVAPLPYQPHTPFSHVVARPTGAALIQPGGATPNGHDDGYRSGFDPQGGEAPRTPYEIRRGGCYAESVDQYGVPVIIDTKDGHILSLYECVTIMNSKAITTPIIKTVEVEARKPMLITVATGLDIPTEKLTPFVNDYKEPAARLGLELIALIGKKKADLTAYMDALIAAVVVEKPAKKEKKPTTPKAVMDAMIDGIVGAFGWNEDNITDGKWGEIRKAAKQLCMVNAKPEQMLKVHAYCKSRFDNFGAIALAKYYADWQTTPAAKNSNKILVPDPEPEPPQTADDFSNITLPASLEEQDALMEAAFAEIAQAWSA